MKKLSLLITLILCVTIGGVYAAWEFAGNNIVDEDTEISIVMGTATDDKSPGTYSVSSNFAIGIEPMDVVNPETNVENANHKADILWALNEGATVPQITFTFDPTEHAKGDQKDVGVISQFYFITSTGASTGTEMKYNGTDVFTFGATKTNMVTINTTDFAGEGLKWTKSGDVFTCTISATDFISLTENFVIDSLEAHNNFKAAIAGTIVVHITDSVVDTQGA